MEAQNFPPFLLPVTTLLYTFAACFARDITFLLKSLTRTTTSLQSFYEHQLTHVGATLHSVDFIHSVLEAVVGLCQSMVSLRFSYAHKLVLVYELKV